MGYKYLTVTYPHNWEFELIFWPCVAIVVFLGWWAIGFRWPRL